MPTVLKPSQLSGAIETLYKANRPCLVQASPGVGKSSIIRQTAARMGVAFHDIRAVLLDPVDLRGLPWVEKLGDGKAKANWAIPSFLPDKGPAIVLIDEINSAPALVQAALYQLILDRSIGEYTLPDDVYVCGAGNKDTDGAVTTRMGTALRSRFIQLEMEPDLEDWTAHAAEADFDPSVIAFVRFRPNLLHKFEKDQKAFPCPRTWEFVSDVMKTGADRMIEHALIEGSVGAGAAVEFNAFLKLYRDLPSMDAIIMNPEKAKVPTEPATLYAVAMALALKATPDNFERVLKYMERCPTEYNVLSVKTALNKTAALDKTKAFVSWAVRYKDAVAL